MILTDANVRQAEKRMQARLKAQPRATSARYERRNARIVRHDDHPCARRTHRAHDRHLVHADRRPARGGADRDIHVGSRGGCAAGGTSSSAQRRGTHRQLRQP